LGPRSILAQIEARLC